MKLENANDVIVKAEFKRFPEKVLIDVGINKLDTDSNHSDNKQMRFSKDKMPNVAIC